MAVTLIVEDGTGIANANSYVSVADFIEYAANRGVTLAADDDTAILLIKGCDYLETLEYVGYKTSLNQSLSWPRVILPLGSTDPASNVIPAGIKKAQMTAALIQQSGTDLIPNGDGAPLIELDVGPITQKWAAPGSSGGVVSFPAVDAQLRGLVYGFNISGGFANIPVAR